jgi:glutamyl-tRNA reductase
MRLVMVGLNHRTAAVEVRERVACAADAAAALIRQLTAVWPVAEAVVLSTCNRTELYLVRPTHQPPSFADLVDLLAGRAGLDAGAMQGHCIHREQKEAVRHLFRVACGFDSMVVGEPQILGQVKRAYEMACVAGTAGPVMHKVFQQAIALAKRVRAQTGVAAGRVSVGSAAVDFARRIFDRFDDKVILGIGAGEMAKLTLRHLQGLRPRRLWVCNRSLDHARTLVEHVGVPAEGGGARPWDDLDKLLVEADVVVSSTGSAQPILTAERFGPLITQRRRRPIFLIDIALPRDVEPGVGSLPNVYLYNIDDLRQVAAAAAQSRGDAAEACESLINDAAERCMLEVERRDVGVLIRKLRQQLNDLAEAEKQRTLRKLSPHLRENGAAAVMEKTLDEHAHRLINKILHVPLSQLHQAHGQATTAFHAAALRRLFDLHETDEPRFEAPPSVPDEHGFSTPADQPPQA